MADIDTSVLIVGVGPAGLASSNLLSRHGHAPPAGRLLSGESDHRRPARRGG